MNHLTDDSTEFAARLTKVGATALSAMPADDVANGMMCAALNICLEVLPHADIADWLRRLADEIEKHDPAAPGRAN